MPSLKELQDNALICALLPWEEDSAYLVGIGRDRQNEGKHDRRSYNADSLMADNQLANIHAAVAELGTCKILGAYWYAGIWLAEDHRIYAELPDALRGKTELEIKWRRTGRKMPVDKKDAERNRLVLWAESKLASAYKCTCETCSTGTKFESRVRLLGGGYAQDLWELGTSYNGDDKRRGVPLEHLTPIKSLTE